MIGQIQQIDFHPTGRPVIRLVSIGDKLSDEIALGADQSATDYAAIGARWGTSTALGGARRQIQFSVRTDHATHEAARQWCIARPALIPWGLNGVVRLTLANGEVWEMQSAQLLGCSCQPVVSREGCRTLDTYRLAGGKTLPIENVAWQRGWPYSWDLRNWGEIGTLWSERLAFNLTGTDTPALDGLWIETGTHLGRPYYTQGMEEYLGDPGWTFPLCLWDSGRWLITAESPATGHFLSNADDAAFPWLATGWGPTGDAVGAPELFAL